MDMEFLDVTRVNSPGDRRWCRLTFTRRLFEAWNAINAPAILFPSVFLESRGPQFLRPRGKLAALPFVFKKWNAESARIGDARNFYQNDRPGAVMRGESARQRRKFGMTQLDYRAPAIQAQNFRRPLKIAEHQDDPAVFFEMGDRLNPATGQVQIGDGRRAKDSQSIEPLRRNVDMTLGIERRRPYEEKRLSFDKFPDGIVNRRKKFSHGVTPGLYRNIALSGITLAAANILI